MGRNHFVMETKGYCLLCLKSSSRAREVGHGHVPDPKNESEKNGENCAKVKFELCSLQRVCHYLKLNMRRVFNEVTVVAPSSLPVLEKSELKGVLCEECSELTEMFSEITLELEVLQMTLDSLVRKLHKKMERIERNPEVMGEFKREMLSSPQTLLHYGMVEQLRRETLAKSALMLQTAQPRVTLRRFNVMDVPAPPPPPPPPPQNDDELPFVEEDEPEASDSVPVISSVQGSYQLSLSTDNDIEVELDPSSILVDVSPRPGSPVSSHPQDTEDPLPPPPAPGKSDYCQICNRNFWSRSRLADHMTSFHDNKRFQCSFCPATFIFRSSRLKHEMKIHNHHQPPRRQGPVCVSVEQASKKKKAANATGGNIKIQSAAPPRRTFPCGFCPSVFNDPSNRSRHRIRIHSHFARGSKKKAIQIQIGSSEMIRLNDAQPHPYLPHHQFGGEGTVEEEMEAEDPLSITMEPDFPTVRIPPPPPVYFSTKSKRFPCRICHKLFRKPSEKLQHEKVIHGGERFICGLCPASFQSKPGLMGHRRRRHGQVTKVVGAEIAGPSSSSSSSSAAAAAPTSPSTPKQVSNHECKICGRSFRESWQKVNHERIMHQQGKSNQFHCGFCPAVFSIRASLYQHRFRKHGHGGPGQQQNRKKAYHHHNPNPRPSQASTPDDDIPPEDKKKMGAGGAQTKRSSGSSGGTNKVDKANPEISLKCPHCDKRFIRRRSLKQHITVAHFPNSQKRRHQCEICQKRYILKTHLSRHRRLTHY